MCVLDDKKKGRMGRVSVYMEGHLKGVTSNIAVSESA